MDLSQLIDTAADSKTEADYEAVFSALKGRQVFVNVLKDEAVPDADVRMPVMTIGDNFRVVGLYTSLEAAQAQGAVAGILWEDALAMVGKIPDVNGLAVHNGKDSWFAIDKAAAAIVLAKA
ncbi:MAG TPA: SseB family protein [Bauldia sp.]|nr:SseB family protein [Bauldia sp.]